MLCLQDGLGGERDPQSWYSHCARRREARLSRKRPCREQHHDDTGGPLQHVTHPPDLWVSPTPGQPHSGGRLKLRFPDLLPNTCK